MLDAPAVALAGAQETPADRPIGPVGTALTVDEALVGRRAVLSVAGEVDICTAARLREAIESAATRAFEIWVDLTATTFMDSSGVHALAGEHERLANATRHLVVICPDGPVRRVLALTGFDQVLEMHHSRRAAQRATS